MNPNCYVCKGAGGWADHVREQSIICPLCGLLPPVEPVKELPQWVTSRWVQMEAKYYGKIFQVIPWLLVIHSGATAPGVAEFFRRSGRVWSEKTKKWVYVSAHLSWSDEIDDLVQCVPFTHVGYHCGGSRLTWKGKLHTHMNFCSYGIELPGPARSHWPVRVLDRLRGSVIHLREQMPQDQGLQVVVRHLDIDKGKRDPGSDPEIFECLSGIGLEMPFAKAA